jgi:hypothetical protein
MLLQRLCGEKSSEEIAKANNHMSQRPHQFRFGQFYFSNAAAP